MLKDEFYIVMEYCDNRDAMSYLTQLQREDTEVNRIRAVLRLCIGVCDAMRYLHSKGYTHRDITACNILVKGDRAMLADLGLAQHDTESNSSSYMPQNHSLYAPPEILNNASGYTRGCDTYCFGIALWEMLVLRRWSQFEVENQSLALKELRRFPLFFLNVIGRCWHEEDLFRPNFDELLGEFVDQHQQEWSTYREVAERRPLSLPLLPPSQALDFDFTSGYGVRVQSFSISDIAENSSYYAAFPRTQDTCSPPSYEDWD